MDERFRAIRWADKSAVVDRLYSQEITYTPLNPGLEAEVVRVQAEGADCILKIWNRRAKPDIGFQYRLLERLCGEGLPVSRPYGWGEDAQRNQVLLTSYDGTPVREADADKLRRIAGHLLDIHRCRTDGLELPRFEFIPYFFMGIEGHPDLAEELQRLVEEAKPRHTALIHGDYNFLNVMENAAGELTIIDWTNGQLGDPRYDIAWSVFLADLYTNDEFGRIYRDAFLTGGGCTAEELEPFEAIAIIRWLLLDRLAGMPRMEGTVPRLKKLMESNRSLRRKEWAVETE